jgi:mono/diheme cytochrome c family protein
MQSLKMLVRIALVVAASFARAADPAPAPQADPDAGVVRGKYLVDTAGCHDCHTPFKMTATGPAWDMDRMLSGHPENVEIPAAPVLPPGPWLATIIAPGTAFAGPWGMSFTANLTPDKETGLGKWTSRTFIDTIRTGRHLGRGREILPPMPIQVYKNFTDQDLSAIFAYLQSIPAVKNKVPAPRPPTAASASAH